MEMSLGVFGQKTRRAFAMSCAPPLMALASVVVLSSTSAHFQHQQFYPSESVQRRAKSLRQLLHNLRPLIQES